MVTDGRLGWVAFEIVKDITDALGDVAVGRAVGTNVRKVQVKTELPLEQVQFRGLLLGQNKYVDMLSLKTIWETRLPVPFKFRLVLLPLVLIDSITFSNSSDRRDVNNDPAVQFVVTVKEFRINSFVRAGAQLAWLAWTLATYPDRATGDKLYPSIPSAEQEPTLGFSEYISSTKIEDITDEDLEDVLPIISNEELLAINILNKRFSKIPFDVNAPFPQTVKVQIPQDRYYADTFNDVVNIPQEYIDFARGNKYDDFYAFPIFNSFKINTLELTIAPKYSDGNKYYTFVLKIDNATAFEQKIIINEIYNIGSYQFTFNQIDINDENIQPEDQESKELGSIMEGGIRPRWVFQYNLSTVLI